MNKGGGKKKRGGRGKIYYFRGGGAYYTSFFLVHERKKGRQGGGETPFSRPTIDGERGTPPPPSLSSWEGGGGEAGVMLVPGTGKKEKACPQAAERHANICEGDRLGGRTRRTETGKKGNLGK